MFISKNAILGFSASLLLFLQPLTGGGQAAPLPQQDADKLFFPRANPDGNENTMIEVNPGPKGNNPQTRGHHRNNDYNHRHHRDSRQHGQFENGRHGEWRSHGHHNDSHEGWRSHGQQGSGHGMGHSHGDQGSGHSKWHSHDHR